MALTKSGGIVENYAFALNQKRRSSEDKVYRFSKYKYQPKERGRKGGEPLYDYSKRGLFSNFSAFSLVCLERCAQTYYEGH